MQRIRKSAAQQIVETVKDVCGHNINFIDSDGVIFASTDLERVGDFHEIGLEVIRTGKTIEVTSDDSYFGTHRGVNIPLHYHGQVIAAIGITGPPEEVRKYARLAQKITGLILREQDADERASSERARLNYVIRSLITGENRSYDSFMELAGRLNIDLNAMYTTAAVRREDGLDSSNLSLLESEIYGVFAQTGSPLFTFSYPNEYILLAETRSMKRCFPALKALGEGRGGGIRVGIGSSEPLTRQSRSYQAAVIALEGLMGEESFAVFEELDLEILLGGLRQGAKERFLDKTVRKLSEEDRTLLRTYFGCGQSLKRTCELMYLHKNTLQYRLDRISRQTGYNPRSFSDGVILYLGLRLL